MTADPQPFRTAEEEQLVLLDWPGKSVSELVASVLLLGVA